MTGIASARCCTTHASNCVPLALLRSPPIEDDWFDSHPVSQEVNREHDGARQSAAGSTLRRGRPRRLLEYAQPYEESGKTRVTTNKPARRARRNGSRLAATGRRVREGNVAPPGIADGRSGMALRRGSGAAQPEGSSSRRCAVCATTSHSWGPPYGGLSAAASPSTRFRSAKRAAVSPITRKALRI